MVMVEGGEWRRGRVRSTVRGLVLSRQIVSKTSSAWAEKRFEPPLPPPHSTDAADWHAAFIVVIVHCAATKTIKDPYFHDVKLHGNSSSCPTGQLHVSDRRQRDQTSSSSRSS